MSLFLSREEVAELTGAKIRRLQIAVLRKNGTRHTINAAGWPVVTRAAVEGEPEKAQDAKPWKSNKAA